MELFVGLTPSEIEKITAAAVHHKVAAGGFFFHQGEPATHFSILLEGRVKLLQVSTEGNQVLLNLIEPGEVFGGVALFGGSVYPVSAQAAEGSEALTWDKKTISRLAEEHPLLSRNALKILSERMKELQDRYREIATKEVPIRLARTLLRLSHCRGGVEIPFSRQELAEMTGTTLFTVSRILSDWQHQGLVTCGRKRLTIRQPAGLDAISQK